MKKFFIGILQFIIYVVSYEVIVFFLGMVSALIFNLLLELCNNYFLARLAMLGRIAESILFTIFPAISALAIVGIMKFIFKGRLYIGSVISMFILLSFAHLSRLIRVVTANGLFTWNTANTIWQSVILCGILCYGLWNMTGYSLEKRRNNCPKSERTTDFHNQHRNLEYTVSSEKDIIYYNNEFKKRFYQCKHPYTGKNIETAQEYLDALDSQLHQRNIVTTRKLSVTELNEMFKDRFKDLSSISVSNMDDYLKVLDEAQKTPNK